MAAGGSFTELMLQGGDGGAEAFALLQPPMGQQQAPLGTAVPAPPVALTPKGGGAFERRLGHRLAQGGRAALPGRCARPQTRRAV